MASKPKKPTTPSQSKTEPPPSAGPGWTHGKVYWSELNTHQVEKVKSFYASSLGWTFEAMPMPDTTYWIIKAGAEMVGGMFEMRGPTFANVPDHWLTYIAVDDIDKRVKKAVKAGAKVVRPAFDVPGVGRIAIVEQPGGGVVGWMTPVAM